MELLRNPIRDYAWGSRSVIAALQGRPVPSAGPEAELWIGAHPSAPSTLDRPEGPVPLSDAIAVDPQGTLGAPAAAEFGPRLPYLLKVLAAERPLSLQAHPSPAQARAGFTAGNRNYVDPYHKPELLVAVSDFEALCGFRDPAEAADLLASFAPLESVVAFLRAGLIRDAVHSLLTWPVADRAALVSAAASSFELTARLAADFPGDMGAVVALLLNHVRLAPGEAIWMPAGNPHAYLRGSGVEIMAASDNVLRGGLTPKHVDVPELLRILRFEVLADPVVRPVPVAPGVVTWPAPVRDFALHRAVLSSPGSTDESSAGSAAESSAGSAAESSAGSVLELKLAGPREVLCLRGEVRLDDGTAPVTVRAGQAAFGPASDAPLVCAGAGELYVASLPA